MISIAGKLALWMALVCTFFQSVPPLVGIKYKNPLLLAFARPSALAQFCFVALAYFLLTLAFGINDFSIAYVADNSHPLLPLMYRLTAVWGAHEGSILLWIFILNSWTIAFTYTYRQIAQHDRTTFSLEWLSLVLAILGIVNGCFLGFLLLTSNPFLLAAAQTTGNDLNPLLQDPGFVIHPPMLYTGYVGFAVTFAITQAALIRGKFDKPLAILARQFAIAAWSFLTFGITLGSWWAYRVLGWGGFWFWDPVENASLLPWLAGTALIHVLLLVEKKDLGKGWAILLGLITFALSLLGTFLVRSGVLISAHTFANDPARGVFLLIILGVLVTAALIIYMIRIQRIGTRDLRITWLSREGMLLLNSGLLIIAACTILLGTLYPLILDALQLGTISVGAPYFNSVMMPIVFVVLFFMGLAPYCQWQSQRLIMLWQDICKNLIISCVFSIFLIWFFTNHVSIIPILALSLSTWVILSVLKQFSSYLSFSLAHTGFAVLIIGIMLSSCLSQERELIMKPGDSATIGPYQFLFLDTQSANGPNYRGIRASFDVLKEERHIASLYPEKRIYTIRQMVMTNVAIEPGIFRDLYLALGEPLDQTGWSVRIYYKPFMRWVWLGGLLMMLGGLTAIYHRLSLFITQQVRRKLLLRRTQHASY